MMDRKHLERVLSINGASLESTDDEIKVVLSAARYTTSESQVAIMVLRQQTIPINIGVNEINRLLRSDTALNAGEVSRLLGITIQGRTDSEKQLSSTARLGVVQLTCMFIVALVISVLGIIAMMYFFEFGIFHTSSQSALDLLFI